MIQPEEKLGVFENSEFILLRKLINIFSDASLSTFHQRQLVIDQVNRPATTKRIQADKKTTFHFESNENDDDESGDQDEEEECETPLLEDEEDSITTPETEDALKALEDFKRFYQNEYKLSEHKMFKQFENLSYLLINNCICSEKWLTVCEWSNKTIYLIVYCLRILLRNLKLQKQFIQTPNSFNHLTRLFLKYADSYSSPIVAHNLLHAHILDQLLNILAKIILVNSSVSKEISKVFFDLKLHVALMELIGASNDLSIIHGSLSLFIYISNSTENKSRLANDLDISDQLLLIIQEYDQDSKKFASKLLSGLCSEEKIRYEVTHLDGIQIFLSLLHKEYINTDIVWNIIWCLVQLCSFSEENKKEIRLMGGIPLILSILYDKNSNEQKSLSDGHRTNKNLSEESQLLNKKRAQRSKYQVQAACCALIGELAFNETNSYQIVNTNGVYLVANKLLKISNIEPQSLGPENEPSKEIERLQINAWRTLRLLFSAERHRSLIKKIIPASMFEQFVDIGNYKKDLNKYQPVLEAFSKLGKDDLETMKQQIKFCNQSQTPINYVNDYAVYEIIGSGAFGRVHKVKKKNSNYFLAMKEINTYNLNSMKDKSLGEIVNEVTIIRNNLKHPNIVRYLKTFKENENLYIVMELIDGASLSQHVRILKEKKQRWPEEKIWNLFIQTVLALKYLHKEKQIVHRDLTSNNIMLSENDKITITDFGLAKLKETSCSKMLSVVGTMFYSCPEIVKNEPYNEKADIWALGCVLYEICCLEPPFCTSNMLALATKITQSDYDETKLSPYSCLVSNVVRQCLVVDPIKRPDVVGVAGLVAEKILTYTDSVRYKCNSLEKKLEKEKNRSQRMLARQQEMRVTSYESQVSKASNETEQSDSGGLSQQRQGIELSLDFDRCEKRSNRVRSSSSASIANETRKNSESDTALDGQKITSSQPLNINVQTQNQSYSPNAKLPPLRDPKSKILIKTIQIRQKKQQTTIASTPPTLQKFNLETPEVTSSTAENFQFVNEVLTSNNGDNFIINAIEPAIFNEKTHAPTNKNDPKQQANPKMQRSTSSSILEKQSSQQKKTRPNSANTPVYKKLRPIEDPILQILDQLHKIIFISQLPPKGSKNFKQKLVDRYKRYLFSNKRTSMHIKSEIMKLIKYSPELIDMEMIGLKSFHYSFHSSDSYSNSVNNQGSTSNVTSGCAINELGTENTNSELNLIISQNGITYEQLQNIIEELLKHNNYQEEKFLKDELAFVD